MRWPVPLRMVLEPLDDLVGLLLAGGTAGVHDLLGLEVLVEDGELVDGAVVDAQLSISDLSLEGMESIKSIGASDSFSGQASCAAFLQLADICVAAQPVL